MKETSGKYVAIRASEADCAAQHIGTEGLPTQCHQRPVWELTHANGQKFNLCEYHIECYWGMWLPFRDAVRDIWPVRH
jgi:hypothetical protein